MANELLIVGSVALDSVKTPFGNVKEALGGSATYASYAASFFTSVRVVGVVGDDFPEEHVELLKSRGNRRGGAAGPSKAKPSAGRGPTNTI